MLRLTDVFIILLKFPPIKLQSIKVAQLKISASKSERNFPTAASRPEGRHRNKLGIVTRVDGATPFSCKQNNALLVVKDQSERIIEKPFKCKYRFMFVSLSVF